jgi:hypothetical protein
MQQPTQHTSSSTCSSTSTEVVACCLVLLSGAASDGEGGMEAPDGGQPAGAPAGEDCSAMVLHVCVEWWQST